MDEFSFSLMAQLVMASGALSLVSLLALHFVSPEYHPSWRMISEYALGKHKWLNHLLLLSLGYQFCVSVVAAVERGLDLVGTPGRGVTFPFGCWGNYGRVIRCKAQVARYGLWIRCSLPAHRSVTNWIQPHR